MRAATCIHRWGMYENYGVSERHLAYDRRDDTSGGTFELKLSIYATIVQGDFISLYAHAFFLSNNIG